MESLVNEERSKPISELPGYRPPPPPAPLLCHISIDFINRAVSCAWSRYEFSKKKYVSRLTQDRFLRSRIQNGRAHARLSLSMKVPVVATGFSHRHHKLTRHHICWTDGSELTNPRNSYIAREENKLPRGKSRGDSFVRQSFLWPWILCISLFLTLARIYFIYLFLIYTYNYTIDDRPSRTEITNQNYV